MPGIEEFLADVGREASVAVSPCPGEVDSDPAQELSGIILWGSG